MNNEKILIVNSDANSRKTLEDLLVNDYQVITSFSCKEALQLYKDEHINTVITELEDEEVAGFEVIREFQDLKSDIPIIVVTTRNSMSLAVEAMKAGAYDYITRPFNADELKFVIMRAVERNKLQEEVKEKKIYQEWAIKDGLTGIYNRRHLDELIFREECRAKRYLQKFSLLIIDVDDFKKLNDVYGHPSGDIILRSLAQLLLNHVRNTDFVARYGGEEFCIIATHTDKNNALVFASRVTDIVTKKEFMVNDSIKTQITISIGVANFNVDAQNKEELVKKADEALYQAKKLGKNRICLFGAGTEEK